MTPDELYEQFFARLARAFGEDVAQEAIVKTWTASQSREILNPEAYLFRTARRLQINHWRSQGNRTMVNIEERLVPGVPAIQEVRAELREVVERFPDVIAAELERGGRGNPRKNSTLDVHQTRARRKARELSG